MKFSLAELEAERVANELIVERKIDSLPVCPFKIAADKGIEVSAKDSDKPGVSGVFMYVGNKFGILYATHIKNDGFLRFTVFHELGHYFIPGHFEQLFRDGVSIHESRSGYVSHDPCERQADVFATTMLMPARLFLSALRQAGAGFPAIESLSRTCRTSITSTALRYARLSEDPIAVIVSSGTGIDYCFISDALEKVRGLRSRSRGTRLPPRSLTASFNKNTANVRDGLKDGAWTHLDDWFGDVDGRIEMKEDVVGLGTYGRTLTVLFTDDILPDEDDEDALNED